MRNKRFQEYEHCKHALVYHQMMIERGHDGLNDREKRAGKKGARVSSEKYRIPDAPRAPLTRRIGDNLVSRIRQLVHRLAVLIDGVAS